MLEYYDGILILTTTRMKTFDIAVQSRIRKHLDFNMIKAGSKAYSNSSKTSL